MRSVLTSDARAPTAASTATADRMAKHVATAQHRSHRTPGSHTNAGNRIQVGAPSRDSPYVNSATAVNAQPVTRRSIHRRGQPVRNVIHRSRRAACTAADCHADRNVSVSDNDPSQIEMGNASASISRTGSRRLKLSPRSPRSRFASHLHIDAGTGRSSPRSWRSCCAIKAKRPAAREIGGVPGCGCRRTKVREDKPDQYQRGDAASNEVRPLGETKYGVLHALYVFFHVPFHVAFSVSHGLNGVKTA